MSQGPGKLTPEGEAEQDRVYRELTIEKFSKRLDGIVDGYFEGLANVQSSFEAAVHKLDKEADEAGLDNNCVAGLFHMATLKIQMKHKEE